MGIKNDKINIPEWKEDEPILSIQHLNKTFKDKAGEVEALKEINIDIKKGEIFGIIGLSGAGKSTLVRCMNYLEEPTEGKVIFKNRNLGQVKPKELRQIRREISMIFQQFNLLSQRSVLRNVTFPLELRGVNRKEAEEKAVRLLKLVDLDGRENAYPSQLSGGQKQRVAIARALATNPSVLLCDEATSALDPNTTNSILSLLQKLNKEMGITIVVITHEMDVISRICNRVAIIDGGKIAESGYVDEIFMAPKTEIGRNLILGDAMRDVEFSEGKMYRITFDGRKSKEPLIANIALKSKAPINIMYAQTKDVGGISYGEMVIQLPSDENMQQEILKLLNQSGIPYKEVDRV